jgi:hypothetical protein
MQVLYAIFRVMLEVGKDEDFYRKMGMVQNYGNTLGYMMMI